jgi:hypothetical protein
VGDLNETARRRSGVVRRITALVGMALVLSSPCGFRTLDGTADGPARQTAGPTPVGSTGSVTILVGWDKRSQKITVGQTRKYSLPAHSTALAKIRSDGYDVSVVSPPYFRVAIADPDPVPFPDFREMDFAGHFIYSPVKITQRTAEDPAQIEGHSEVSLPRMSGDLKIKVTIDPPPEPLPARPG